MEWAKRLEKITSRTGVLYALIAILVVVANPSWISCFFGLIFVAAGEALRFWAAGHIRKNDELTTSGPYAHLQSPLYLGSFIIGAGMCIMGQNPVIFVLTSVVFFLAYVPRKQEKEWGRLERMFGEEFLKYKQAVPYFFPRIEPYPDGAKHPWSFTQAIENTEHQTGIVVFVIAIFIMVRLF